MTEEIIVQILMDDNTIEDSRKCYKDMKEKVLLNIKNTRFIYN